MTYEMAIKIARNENDEQHAVRIVELYETIERLRDALYEYGVHGVRCLAGQRRAGRPTVDGGYETLYGYGVHERWYPSGESPECTCGLNAVLHDDDSQASSR